MKDMKGHLWVAACALLGLRGCEGVRSVSKAAETFDHVLEMRCETASPSDTCVQRCQSSPACQSAPFFEVALWRQCLKDLGSGCTVEPLVAFGAPVTTPATSCVLKDKVDSFIFKSHKVRSYTPILPRTEDGAFVGLRWSIATADKQRSDTALMEECVKDLEVDVEYGRLTDVVGVTSCVFWSPTPQTFANVPIKKFNDDFIGFEIQVPSGVLFPAFRIKPKDPQRYPCFFYQEGEELLPHFARFSFETRSRRVVGFDAYDGPIKPFERSEFVIGNTPLHLLYK